ncbi:MAG: mechanosensitive ion channel protein MscS [Candidatus Rokuibacteriota bacterium]|nr:MAG: mechanosensitive ion channel protein MscS [Candidatus Rokubacteria bacterium]
MSGLVESVAELIARLTHLEGPGVAILARLVAVAVTLLLAFAAYGVLGQLVERVLRRAAGADEPSGTQRVHTLAPLLKNLALYALSFVVGIVVLQEVGVDVRALAVSAGVLGLAVGFGAQSLIKDVITGFFILFEGLVRVGDVIEVGGHTGVVEAIGLRVTRLRLFNGAQRIVPNGDLTQFANYNRGWARAVVDVGVTYDTDVRRALEALERVGRDWATETGLGLDAPLAQGIVRFGETEVGLRLSVKVMPAGRADAESDLRRRIKEAFDRDGLELAAPQRAIYLKPQEARA